MRNFYRLCEGIDTVSIVHALHSRPELWNRNSLRRDTAELAECDDIWLRFPSADGIKQGLGEFECVNYPAMAELPAVRSIIFGLMRQIEGERLGPVMISRLPPGGRIYPHDDGAAHTAYYKRYFLTLHAKPGCIFRAGEEAIEPKVGELYWFDNSVEHEVINNSADDRMSLIIDVRSCA
jgi:hypothetical protein